MRHALPLALALLLAGCQPHVSPNSRPTAETERARTVGLSAAARELMKSPFVCGEAHCPAGVGVFTALTEMGYVTCTGFLVGDRTFVTNRQCLPDALKQRGVTCRGQAAVAFLDHGQTRVVDCKTVLDVSPDERSLKPDFAYLELDASQPGAWSLSREGVRDDQKLTAWAVTRVEGRHVLGRSSCRVVTNSLLNPLAASTFSAVAIAVGCAIQPGNSGAPLVDEDGDVVGLMQSRAIGDHRQALSSLFKDQAVRLPDTLPPHVNFTNLACVTNPTNGAGPHPNCARVALATAERCGVNVLKTDDAREAVIDRVVSGLPSIFKYKVAWDERRGAVVAEPICTQTELQDVGAYVKYVKLSKWLQFRSLDLTYDGLTKLDAVVETDEALRVKPALTFKTGVTWPQRYRLDFKAGAWTGTVSRERQPNDSFSLDVSIPQCTGEQASSPNQRVYRATDGREFTAAEWRQRLDADQAERCAR